MIEHHWNEIHHVESQRAGIASIVVLVASGCVGLFFSEFVAVREPVAWVLVVIGGYGMMATEKLYERYSFTQNRLNTWYPRLDALCPDAHFLQLRRGADEAHARTFKPRWARWISVSHLWISLHFLVLMLGEGLILLTRMGWTGAKASQ